MNEHEDNIFPEEENFPPQPIPEPLPVPAEEMLSPAGVDASAFILNLMRDNDTGFRAYLSGLTKNIEFTNDLLQDFYSHIFFNADFFSKKLEENGLGYFYTCIKNLFLNAQRSDTRRIKRHQILHEGGFNEAIFPDPGIHIDIEEIKKIAKLLLNEIDFLIFEMKLEDASTEEIMQACGLSKGNVAVRWNRIRKKLRDYFGKGF